MALSKWFYVTLALHQSSVDANAIHKIPLYLLLLVEMAYSWCLQHNGDVGGGFCGGGGVKGLQQLDHYLICGAV